MTKIKKTDYKELKKQINEKHINFYDKTLSILEFVLEEYSKELVRTDVEFLDMLFIWNFYFCINTAT